MASPRNPYTAQKEAIAFPTLSMDDMQCLTPIGHCRLCRDGELLFEAGQANPSFFVIIHGKVRIAARQLDGTQTVITEHEPGHFTGDVDILTGRPPIADGVCVGPTDVIEIQPADIRRIVAEQADLGEVILRAFLMRRALVTEAGSVGARLIGSNWSRETSRLREFLARNQVLFSWLDPEDDPSVQALLDHFGVTPEETPVVICPDGRLLKNPTDREVADCLGLRPRLRPDEVYDLVVIGAGPAGLAAAVYGASEGLRTLVVEGVAPGGQAGSSSKIENYLGFPTGVSGDDLTRRATIQAQKFGATITSPQRVTALACQRTVKRIDFDGGDSVITRSVVIATGANYRRLQADGCDGFEGAGVFYSATAMEARACRGEVVFVVGGGNSAGQAAVFLAGHAERVHIVIRRDSLAATMSRYLIDRIERTPNIEVCAQTEIVRMEGDSRLRRVTLRNGDGRSREVDSSAVFVMIGADPRTDWLGECIGLDDKGFILTGADAGRVEWFAEHWPLKREPFLLETTAPGIFAAGDARSGSVKRVASAVGEGSMAIKYVHEWLAG